MSHAAGYTASYFRHRIEDHFEEQELDVICRKQKHAYALYWADDRTPLAKIQRMGQGDEVHVWWWDDGRWRQTGESGTTLSLDKALEYITDDPDHRFFSHDDAEESELESDDSRLYELKLGAPLAVQPNLTAWVMFSSAVGGLAGGPGLGAVGGVLAAVIGLGGVTAVRGRSRVALKKALTAGAPVALLAVPAATIGGLVHETQAAGAWGYVVGALAGALSALFMLQRSWCAWLLGATAGIVAAKWLAELVRLREHLLGLLLIVFVASCVARFYAVWIRSYRHAIEFFQSLVDGEFDINDR